MGSDFNLNEFLLKAHKAHASDVHFREGKAPSLRVDGKILRTAMTPLDEEDFENILATVARKDILESIRMSNNIDFTYEIHNLSRYRVNFCKDLGMPKLTMRVIPYNIPTLEDLSLPLYLGELTKFNNGIILVTGPTGSGKSTTLAALVDLINKEQQKHIITIEDPVEIRLDGVNQSAVNPKAGITFATCMRAILRQDPDVILVGEIRDYETLEVAISASLTGHFVLSTIHTNSAAATVTRLIEMGAKDYLISSTLNGVLAQRLVKKLCPDCKRPYKPTEEDARKILTDPERIKQLMETTLYRAEGCPNCGGTGYKGRLALLEILVVTKEIKKLIAAHAHDIEIEEHAVKNGMRTLNESCIRHIIEGNTTIDEFVRVLGLVGE